MRFGSSCYSCTVCVEPTENSQLIAVKVNLVLKFVKLRNSLLTVCELCTALAHENAFSTC